MIASGYNQKELETYSFFIVNFIYLPENIYI